MKKLILFFLLTASIFAQGELLLLMSGGYNNTETTKYLAGQTVSGVQATRIDNFVSSLKDSLGITALSSKFDVMYLLANQNAALALRNLVKRSHDATAVNSPTFTAWEGFLSAATKYLNTNYTPKTDGVAYTLNSASYGLYSRTDASSSYASMGSNSVTDSASAYFYARLTTTHYGNINQDGSTGRTAGTVANSLGLLVQTRTASNATHYYQNAVLIDDGTATSTVLPALPFYITTRNDNGSPNGATLRQIAFAFTGATLSATEVRKLFNCLEVYLIEIGASVL